MGVARLNKTLISKISREYADKTMKSCQTVKKHGCGYTAKVRI